MDDDRDVAAPDAEPKAERRSRKQGEAERQPLGAWERYRALSDQVDHMLDVIEMADRRTRFAMVLLGMLNAANLLIAMQRDVLGATTVNQVVVQVYICCYVLLSMYFMFHAVSALRPRSRQMGRTQHAIRTAGPGVRLVDDILAHDPERLYDVWRTAPAGALSRELSIQVFLLARTTAEKYSALNKVYTGVLVLLSLTAIFVVLLGLHALAPSLV